MRVAGRGAAVAAIVALGAISSISARGAFAGDLVPYQSVGWRYQSVTPGDPLEALFYATGFDDSAWPLGQGAFGSKNGCPLEPSINTTWNPNTNMLLRRTFIADPLVPVVLHFAVDNDANVWVNNTLVAAVVHEYCAGLDDFSAVVPAAVVVLGVNVVAIQAIDRGGVSYFDMRIEGDAPVPTLARSWGALKTIYR